MLAKAVAGEATIPFLFISVSEFGGDVVGMVLPRSGFFKQAKTRGTVYRFMDEIDAIGKADGKSAATTSGRYAHEPLMEMTDFPR
ncbi:MAG: AAA family ATPase [Dysosmobacter sp.]